MTTLDITSLKFEIVPVNKLKPHPKNPKIHSQDQIDGIAKSITLNGWGRPILATRDLTIIAGHATTQAAKSLGMTEVPVVILDISPERAITLMLADNRYAEMAETDTERLALIFQELQLDFPDMDLEGSTGYSLSEITKFMPTPEAEDDGYDAPEEYQAIKDPVTRRGDLYILGPHRLLCGDSTNPRDLKTLMNGQKAQMTFTDPQYNVNYDQKNGSPRKEAPKSGLQNNTILNDNMSTEEFQRFMDKVCRAIFEHCKGPVYICMSCKEWPRIHKAFEDAGGHWSSTIIWNKSNFVLSRKDYHPKFEPILYGWEQPAPDLVPDYEPILYGWREGDQVKHLESRSKSDVWEFKKPAKNVEHPTMKPIELVAEAIGNSSDMGDTVLDLFGGAGSTLIAAHQLGRQAYLMELDPKYCDVIVNRWQQYTGEKAVRIPAPDTQLTDGDQGEEEDPEEENRAPAMTDIIHDPEVGTY